jgi:putative tryptophan/tyrosine transport system substrate-binding protein
MYTKSIDKKFGHFLTLVLIISCVCVFGTEVKAYGVGVVIVESKDTEVSRDIIGGIESIIMSKAFVIDADAVGTLAGPKPKAFITIGSEALIAVENWGVPVIFSATAHPRSLGIEGRQITGVDFFISPDTQFDQIRAVLPKALRVGIVYSPYLSGYILDSVKEAAEKKGFVIISRVVKSPEEAVLAINKMTDVDVILMLPDVAVTTLDMVKHLMVFSVDHKIPVVGLSEKYVEKGALMAVGINPRLLGQQIGKLTNRVLSGEKASSIPIEPVRDGSLYINVGIAKNFKLQILHEVLKRANLYGF